jgi:hypothetical protein
MIRTGGRKQDKEQPRPKWMTEPRYMNRLPGNEVPIEFSSRQAPGREKGSLGPSSARPSFWGVFVGKSKSQSLREDGVAVLQNGRLRQVVHELMPEWWRRRSAAKKPLVKANLSRCNGVCGWVAFVVASEQPAAGKQGSREAGNHTPELMKGADREIPWETSGSHHGIPSWRTGTIVIDFPERWGLAWAKPQCGEAGPQRTIIGHSAGI